MGCNLCLSQQEEERWVGRSWGAGSVLPGSRATRPRPRYDICLLRTVPSCLPAWPACRADTEMCGWGAGMAATWPSSRSTPPSSLAEVRAGVGG
jgi:hypothetical protein